MQPGMHRLPHVTFRGTKYLSALSRFLFHPVSHHEIIKYLKSQNEIKNQDKNSKQLLIICSQGHEYLGVKYVLWRGYVLEYLVVNRIVVKEYHLNGLNWDGFMGKTN
jgi:hypothetical protein